MIKKLFKWRKRPQANPLRESWMQLNWELFSTEKGQEYLYLWKQMMGYDRNSYSSYTDRLQADMHEGKKDAVRMIEEGLQRFSLETERKDKEDAKSK